MHKGLDPAHVNTAIVNDDIDGVGSDGVDTDTEYVFIASMGNEPGSLDEALSGPHADKWQPPGTKRLVVLMEHVPGNSSNHPKASR